MACHRLPDGMEEAQVVTGSRYSGITYNNVSVASATDTNAQREVKPETQLSDVQFNEKKVYQKMIYNK